MASEHSWNHDFCGCCSAFGTSCLACWCPCILYGRTKYRLQNKGDPELTQGYSACNGACALHGLLLTFTTGIGSAVLQMIQRGDIRNDLRVSGGACTDCLAACCCPCCQLVQEDRETKDWQHGKHPHYAAMVPPQPGKQEGMMYQAPAPQYPPQAVAQPGPGQY